MMILKIIKNSALFPVLLLFGIIYSCEDPTSAEAIKEVEDQSVTESMNSSQTKVEEESLKWCIFGNYCDESGRHYPAKFLVNIWQYGAGEKQEQLYKDYSNEVEKNEAGDFAGTTLCVDLPNSSGENEYYIEITILNSDAYGQISEEVIREGILDESEIKNLYIGEDRVDYFHFREGCDSSDTPDILSN